MSVPGGFCDRCRAVAAGDIHVLGKDGTCKKGLGTCAPFTWTYSSWLFPDRASPPGFQIFFRALGESRGTTLVQQRRTLTPLMDIDRL